MNRIDVAEYVADHLESDRATAIEKAAAWLIETQRSDQADYLASDVATILERRGELLVEVMSAHPLSAGTKIQIEQFLQIETQAKTLSVTYSENTKLVGGIQIQTPTARINTSIQARLNRLVKEVSA